MHAASRSASSSWSIQLDSRAGRMLFLFGQIAYEDALELERQAEADDDRPDDEKPDEEDVKPAFEEAIGLWKRVVSKYRNSEEASLALYRIALIHEEKFGDWKTALETYRQITWGSKAANARTRIQTCTHGPLAREPLSESILVLTR